MTEDVEKYDDVISEEVSSAEALSVSEVVRNQLVEGTNLTIVKVTREQDGHVFSIPFKEDKKELSLLNPSDVSSIDNPHVLRQAVLKSIHHLRENDFRKLVLEPEEIDTPDTGMFTHYYYVGWEKVHIFEDDEATSLCDGESIPAVRQDLEKIDKPITEINGVCRDCLRKMKSRGDFEAYLQPDDILF